MTDAQFGILIGAISTLGAGFVGFLKWAFSQWLNDRKEEREERRGEFAAVVDIQLTLAAMLERDRIRDERRKRESMQPPNRGSRVPNETWDHETSNVVEIKEDMRRRLEESRMPTPAAGVRTPRPGTHHDGER